MTIPIEINPFSICNVSGEVVFDCSKSDKSKHGVKPNTGVIPKENVLSLVYDANQPNVITDIVRQFGTRLMLIEGEEGSVIPNDSSEASDTNVTFFHRNTTHLFKVDPATALFAQKLSGTRILQIYEDSNNFFRVQGWGGGMKVMNVNITPQDQATSGGFVMESEGDRENGFPLYLASYDYTDPANPVYDYAATRALYEALFTKPTKNIVSVTPGATTIVEVATTSDIPNGYVATFSGIVGSVGDTLNGNAYAVTIIDSTTFSIAVDTTALTYTSGGLIQ